MAFFVVVVDTCVEVIRADQKNAEAVARMLKQVFNGGFYRFHSFRSLMLYSTSEASKDQSPPLVEFLSKSVGFSEKEASSIVAKVRYFSKHSTKQPEQVIDFLKSNGFNETHIRKLLTRAPYLVRCKIETTLEPKIRVFRELGLRGSDLGLVISQHAYNLHLSLKAHIAPSLEILRSIVGSNEELISLLMKIKSPLLLSSRLFKNLPPNLLLMQSYGVTRDKIKHLLIKRPLIMMQKTQWLEGKLKAVEEKLGIPRTSAMFVHGLDALSKISDDRLESWLRVIRSYGWSETEISMLLRKHPLSLCISGEQLSTRLNYFMEELGYGSDYLASRPALLTYSMEKRTMPRVAVIQALKEKHLLKKDIKLYSFMVHAESMFLEKFVMPFKDKLPQLYQDYMQQTSGVSLSKS